MNQTNSISGPPKAVAVSPLQAASRARVRPKAAGCHRKHPEDDIQKSVVDHLNRRGVPGLVFWHTPNSSKLGGKRTRNGRIPLAAIRLKKLGLRAGVSDLILVHKNNIYALELKSEIGTPTEEQLKFLTDIQNAGAYACVCHGAARALAVLEQWGLLTGRAV